MPLLINKWRAGCPINYVNSGVWQRYILVAHLTGASLGLETGQPWLLDEFEASERPCHKKWKRSIVSWKTTKLILGPPCTATDRQVHICAHMHLYKSLVTVIKSISLLSCHICFEYFVSLLILIYLQLFCIPNKLSLYKKFL